MTRRIFRSIMAVAAAVLAASVAIIMCVLYEYFTSVQRQALSTQLALAAQGVQNEGIDYFADLDADDCRLTWVDSDGTVLYDNESDAAKMDNHADREEIAEALQTGVGESTRLSSTIAEKTLYRAVRLNDGTVLRAALTQRSVTILLIGAVRPIVVVVLGALLLSALLARRLSQRVVKPLNELDLDNPLDNDVYDELSALLTRIEHQHRQIAEQMAELKRRQDEFSAITSNMSEGLILLDADGAVLSINPAAARLFGAGDDCIGRNVLTVCRAGEIQALVGPTLAGERRQSEMNIAGRSYFLHSGPVRDGERIVGACVLVFDDTERAEAEKRRREFSANVSHELKTPLQSIIGAAELMENGLVEEKDVGGFAARIRGEGQRLVTLIDDIIRLSQLDEGGEMPREPVELCALASAAAAALKESAAARSIEIELSGEPETVCGVRQLLYEMIYNLCDNAVKYNVDGGKVVVEVGRDVDGRAYVSVSDTGIGIQDADRERIFERFYRADKSRSKQTGGTGLGLSIVKHAAICHDAALKLESEPQRGSRFTVTFLPQA